MTKQLKTAARILHPGSGFFLRFFQFSSAHSTPNALTLRKLTIGGERLAGMGGAGG
jgi:hypothetical protein